MHLNLKSARHLINHLISWGEVSRFELDSIAGAQDWIALFEQSGVVRPVNGNRDSDVWCLSPGLWILLKEEPEKAVRTILFQVPLYREYLISILAEGVASAAKQGLYNEEKILQKQMPGPATFLTIMRPCR